jgi:AraC-like DNA-binding protein
MIETHKTRHSAGTRIAAHRHRHAYAALVLSGSYQESGPEGLWQCSAGELVVHPPYHLHANRMGNGGARVLNFELPVHIDAKLDRSYYGVYVLPDPGRLERVSCRDPYAALAEAEEVKHAKPSRTSELWLDRLAEALGEEPARPIAALAEDYRYSSAHLSRAFRNRFGIAPVTFRREQRLRRALRLLSESDQDLCDIAAECGYADQPHMNRELKQLTGVTPQRLRKAARTRCPALPDQLLAAGSTDTAGHFATAASPTTIAARRFTSDGTSSPRSMADSSHSG